MRAALRHLDGTKKQCGSRSTLFCIVRSGLEACVPFETDTRILDMVSLNRRILVPLWPIATAILDRNRKLSLGKESFT